MNQQVRIGLSYNNTYVKDLDPRAIIFEPFYKPLRGEVRYNQLVEYDYCNPNELNHLNMANNATEGILCLKDAEN